MDEISMEGKNTEEHPKCHMTPMDYVCADDGTNGQVEYWECRHCGHTKEVMRHQTEG